MRVRNFVEDVFEGRQKAWPFFLERKGTFRELSSGAMDVFAGLTISFATHVNIISPGVPITSMASIFLH